MKENRGKAVAILAGGNSEERPVSLASAKQIKLWLEKTEYIPYIIDIQGFQWEYTEEDGAIHPFDTSTFTLPIPGRTVHFAAALIATHGDPGENGLLQGYLEMRGIPHTTGDVLAQSLSFHKAACKRYLQGLIPMAPSIELNSDKELDMRTIAEEIGYPLFVKPTDNGSSVGVYMVKAEEELKAAVIKSLQCGASILIERAIRGVEVSCGMVHLEGKDIVFPITQLIAKDAEFFDFKSKYSGEAQEITPAPIPEDTAQRIAEYMRIAYHQLRLRGMARAEFIIENGTPYFLEINTVPGMTATSILPQQVAAYGWTMEDLLARVLNEVTKEQK
ncbi:MAG: D-alanine--D-alanine ligase [Bacteroidia bacterium]|nr:MAG: D-alanine--D-alanine ligase [Bacteroidia bacterium]